ILNNLRFSDGREYRIQLDFPISLATGKAKTSELHFRVIVPTDPSYDETIEHGSPAETRLVELLEDLVGQTHNAHETKNATPVVRFLKNRKQPFPTVHAG